MSMVNLVEQGSKRMNGTLVIVTVLVLLATAGVPALHAQDSGVTATSSALDSTIIVTIDNSGTVPIHSVKLWLAEGNSFESFKTSGGWTGLIQAPNLLTFSVVTPVDTGESAKFGVVTSLPTDGINWQALDVSDTEITRNFVVPTEASEPQPIGSNPSNVGSGDTPTASTGILDDSTFRVIPTSPNIGSQVRIAGDGFGSQKSLTLLLGTLNLSTIQTNDSGVFVHTVRIPDQTAADRVEFTLNDNEGSTLQRSVRIGEVPTRMVHAESRGLVFNNIPSTITASDTVMIAGTGTPGEFIVLTIVHPAGYAIENSKLQIKPNGSWSRIFETSSNSSVGLYSATVTDGATTLKKTWAIETGDAILVSSGRVSYETGEELIFRGTAAPDQTLIVRLTNPQNIPLYEEAIPIDSTGRVSFEIPTTSSYTKGTYAAHLSQGSLERVIPIGIGGRPDNLFEVKTDKINYDSNQSANVTVHGSPESEAVLSISNTAKQEVLLTTSIRLGVDGLYQHELPLKDYPKAIYTATVSYGRNSSDRDFSVGFAHNAGAMDINTIKSSYIPTEPIIVIGSASNDKTLVDIALVSPSGIEEQADTIFTVRQTSAGGDTRKSAAFNAVFFIHSNDEPGLWKVVVKSTNETAEAIFEIASTLVEEVIITADLIDSDTGSAVLISGTGVTPGRQLGISITYNSIDVIEDSLLVRSTSDGTFVMEWTTLEDLFPGTYTIVVTGSEGETAETKLVIE